MSIENANYIHELNVSNPKPVDPISEGDNHIRLIKKLLTESFPSDLDGMVVPNITDNGDKYLRVNEDATAVEWHEVQVQGAGIIPFRSQLSYKDESTVILGPGEYTHKDQPGTLSWTEDKELTISNPSGNFTYIYLDNSGTVTPSWSGNGPTWSNAARGWYLDDKRCIGAVPIKNGNVRKFWDDASGYIQSNDDSTRAEFSGGGSVWNTISYSAQVPSFSDWIQVFTHFISPENMSLSCHWYVKPWSEPDENETWVGVTQAGGAYGEQHLNFVSKYRTIDKKLQWKGVSQHTHKGYTYSLGYYLPRGM